MRFVSTLWRALVRLYWAYLLAAYAVGLGVGVVLALAYWIGCVVDSLSR